MVNFIQLTINSKGKANVYKRRGHVSTPCQRINGSIRTNEHKNLILHDPLIS